MGKGVQKRGGPLIFFSLIGDIDIDIFASIRLFPSVAADSVLMFAEDHRYQPALGFLFFFL